jgi:hypothetical protein
MDGRAKILNDGLMLLTQRIVLPAQHLIGESTSGLILRSFCPLVNSAIAFLRAIARVLMVA